MSHQLPLLDISAFRNGWDSAGNVDKSWLITDLTAACSDTGFFYLVGHAVPRNVVEAVRHAVQGYFSLPEERKRELTILKDNYRGYIPLGFFTPNDGEGVAEQYEGFKLHYEVAADDPVCQQNWLYGPNRWPVSPPEFRDALTEYWECLDKVSDVLLRAAACSLELEEHAFIELFREPLTNMTLLHYPPMGQGQEGYGIHPHKDTDAFTILYPDPVGGLQVRHRDGSWIEAGAAGGAPEDAFVVNIGDMMEVWSGGRFVSTPHRVINRTGRERYSFPWFAVPRHDVMIEPMVKPLAGFQRKPVSSGEWSEAIWYTNYPEKKSTDPALHLGSLRD